MDGATRLSGAGRALKDNELAPELCGQPISGIPLKSDHRLTQKMSVHYGDEKFWMGSWETREAIGGQHLSAEQARYGWVIRISGQSACGAGGSTAPLVIFMSR